MGTASSFPYAQEHSLLQPPNSIWTVYKAHTKEDNQPVTIFRCNAQAKQSAINFTKRIKTLRHPALLKYIDSTDTPEAFYIVTEAVTPLAQYWDTRAGLSAQFSPSELSLGLFQLTSALSFLNNDAKMAHTAVSIHSIWVTRAGEWKLGGFETTRDLSASDQLNANLLTGLPHRYLPPDLAKTGSSVAAADAAAVDSWAVGCLIYEMFNGEFVRPQELTTIGRVPDELVPQYKLLLATAPKNRLNIADLVLSPFFQTDLVQSVDFLDNLALKNQAEKDEFFKNLADRVEGFPVSVGKYKILPQLMNALQFGSGTGAKVLAAMLAIAKKLTDEEYSALVVPVIIKLYSSNERAMRVNLLKNLSYYINYLDEKLVNKDIFPNVKSGFTDTVSVLREWTVKSLLHFMLKLKENTIITQVIPFIPRLQRDPEAAIRTNTTVVIGKVAKQLSPNLREKLLIPTFCRALRDPFVPARKSAMAAFKATAEFYSAKDLAGKIIPVISVHCIDPSKEVRDLTVSCLQVFLEILQKNSDQMPQPENSEMLDPASPYHPESNTVSSGGNGANTESKESYDLMGTIGNWAIQAAANKILGSSSEQVSQSDHSYNPPATSASNSSSSASHSKPPVSNHRPATSSTAAASSTNKKSSEWNDSFMDNGAADNDWDVVSSSLTFGNQKPKAKTTGTTNLSRSSSSQSVQASPQLGAIESTEDIPSPWTDFDNLLPASQSGSKINRGLEFDLAIGSDFDNKSSTTTSMSDEDLFKNLTIGAASSSSGSIVPGKAASSNSGRGPIPMRKGKPAASASGQASSGSKPVESKKAGGADGGWEDFLNA